jgi:hypothetical protein
MARPVIGEVRMPLFHKFLEGPNGRIEVTETGLLVGKIAHWTLRRRAEQGSDSDVFDLHATLKFVVEAIWNDPDYEKTVLVQIGRGSLARWHRIVQLPGQRTALQGNSLIMERVNTATHDDSD